jgi:hypothetical protein
MVHLLLEAVVPPVPGDLYLFNFAVGVSTLKGLGLY